MKITEDRFFAEIFGHEVFKVEINPEELNLEGRGGPAISALKQHAARQPRAFYYAKVDTGRIEVVQRLSAAGFYAVEVNVIFGLETKSKKESPVTQAANVCEIAPARAGQHQEVLEIAATTFRFSRFHLDPLIPDAVANRIKHDWIGNYLQKKRGEQLWVAAVQGRPAGFLAVLASKDNGKEVRTIDLIGVGRDFKRQGIGLALTEFFIKHYWDRCQYLQVGTQIANFPSLGLYQKAGFQIAKTAYVMHLHVRDGRPLS
jgi:ribosomal protein S18 acetylase RimI-like enzyme